MLSGYKYYGPTTFVPTNRTIRETVKPGKYKSYTILGISGGTFYDSLQKTSQYSRGAT